MKRLGYVILYEISAEFYDMLLEEWGRVLQTRSEYYPWTLVICQAHLKGLTRDHLEEFIDELKQIVFAQGGLVLLRREDE